jgi:hypothetical protein
MAGHMKAIAFKLNGPLAAGIQICAATFKCRRYTFYIISRTNLCGPWAGAQSPLFVYVSPGEQHSGSDSSPYYVVPEVRGMGNFFQWLQIDFWSMAPDFLGIVKMLLRKPLSCVM